MYAHPILQVMVVPYIEDNNLAMEEFRSDEPAFWRRLLDPNDVFARTIKLLVVDGAHRRFISVELKLESMFVIYLKPNISFGELVRRFFFVVLVRTMCMWGCLGCLFL